MFKVKTRRTILIHSIVWIAVLLLPVLLSEGYPSMFRRNVQPSFIILNINLFLFFYFNAYFLIPQILRKRSRTEYIFWIVICFAFLIGSDYFWRICFDAFRGWKTGGRIFYFVFFIWAVSTAFRIFNDQQKADRLNNERENIHLKTELAFLRTQISPHFIFNILNSIVALTRKYPDRVEPMIVNLSDILRYMIYENDDRKVSLDREINYLQSYIDLQNLRFGDSVRVNVAIANNTSNRFIEPMLLIPFIENAFKHGVGLIADPVIEIHLSANERELNFSVRNRYNDVDQKDNNSGIGISNVTRRLNILYNNKHEISLNKNKEWYKADLKIEFE